MTDYGCERWPCQRGLCVPNGLWHYALGLRCDLILAISRQWLKQEPVGVVTTQKHDLAVEPIIGANTRFGIGARYPPCLHMTPREAFHGDIERYVEIPTLVEQCPDGCPPIGLMEQVQPFDDHDACGGPNDGSTLDRIADGVFESRPLDLVASRRRAYLPQTRVQAIGIERPGCAAPSEGFGGVGKSAQGRLGEMEAIHAKCHHRIGLRCAVDLLCQLYRQRRFARSWYA